MASLAERLGFSPDDCILIINCDDLGLTHSTNVGCYEALRSGVATSATLMMPCAWSREAAARYEGDPVGIHLTLNSEHDLYRWGPMTRAPSLLDGDGGFPRTLTDLWDHADLDEVLRECRTQIERAIWWGFDVTHLDSHMGALQQRPEFFDIYLELAVEFQVPLRLSGASTEAAIGFPFRRLAAEEGVIFPDHFVRAPGVGSREVITQALSSPRPGVTEIYLHPATATPEQQAFDPSWRQRVDDLEFARAGADLERLVEHADAKLISYRELRDVMRAAP